MHSTQNTTYSTIASQLSIFRLSSIAKKTLLVILGSFALWASAKVSIPFYPVSMTMQTFVVLVIGMSYGWKLGGTTIMLYLLEGFSGLPVFAGTPIQGIGAAYMMGPTGGYLLGFLLASVTVGLLAERGWDRKLIHTITALTIGTTIIFACGLLWLGIILGWDKPIFTIGFTPFAFAALLKIGLASVTLSIAWKFIQKKH